MLLQWQHFICNILFYIKIIAYVTELIAKFINVGISQNKTKTLKKFMRAVRMFQNFPGARV